MQIDHVVLAVRDLDGAAARFEGLGIASAPGGVHPRWGTANRIAPLGDTYLELLAVVDEAVGRGTALGSSLLERSDGGDRWFALCLRDEAIDATAGRLGLDLHEGSRTRPDGSEIRWRGAGIEDPRRTSDLPFFIAWETPASHPGREPIVHPAGRLAIAAVEVAGDPASFLAWVGADIDVAVRFTDGPHGVRAVVLDSPGGPIRIDGAAPA